MIIGLEYIAKIFQVEYKTIAEILGISPKTVNDWVKGRKNIPENRLKQLAQHFELKEEYFQKELSKPEAIEVQIKNVIRQSQNVDVERTIVDELGKEHLVIETVNDSEALIQLLNEEKARASLLSEISKMVDVDNGKEYNLNFFQDLVRLIKEDRSKRLVFLLIGSMSRAIGNANYGVKENEEEVEFIKAFRELLPLYGLKGKKGEIVKRKKVLPPEEICSTKSRRKGERDKKFLLEGKDQEI
ncbi:helix-turn-helix domain-containing protein [Desulfosporosinus hippei]|uniref:Helix-turn-helix n=1 Tax=Desulfosporosinus hippei DSM 8344 TaxID=1121419 RepID=A0A1G7Z5E4_9FIRM|nr:helix-turn-helix domain-containing protein [Desulfosporosinus hippei]SDH03992.1 Helix-turn-helix [Desulfosporosinus hippei DSM 8344]